MAQRTLNLATAIPILGTIQYVQLLQYLSIFVCFLDVLQDPDGLLFPGSQQYEQFRNILRQQLKKHKGDLDGYEVEDIGTHSIRKGASTYAASGSTASPSSVAINNCGCWTLGTV